MMLVLQTKKHIMSAYRTFAKYSLLCLSLLFSCIINAQELFPHTEPASNSPKGALGIRMSNEFYKDVTVWRSMQCYRFFLAINEKIQVTPNFTFSNHHGFLLPEGFIKNDGNSGPHTHGSIKGSVYPYSFENLSFNVKYRFFTNDKQNYHFRIAAFGEVAAFTSAHDEAEPSLVGDNSGAGFGIVTTLLKNKFAVSITSGAILPNKYYQKDTNQIELKYGNAYHYSLSMGYLLLPFKYKSYNQPNVNLYVEFIGKSYDKAKITLNDRPISVFNIATLEKGNYIEIRPSIQLILKSITRIDLSMGFPFINRSYVRTSPTYYFSIQRYFFY